MRLEGRPTLLLGPPRNRRGPTTWLAHAARLLLTYAQALRRCCVTLRPVRDVLAHRPLVEYLGRAATSYHERVAELGCDVWGRPELALQLVNSDARLHGEVRPAPAGTRDELKTADTLEGMESALRPLWVDGSWAALQKALREPPEVDFLDLAARLDHERINAGGTNQGKHAPLPNGEARLPLYCVNWAEILAALNLKRADKDKVRKLNEEHGGPIILPQKGGQPKVERGKLLSWWVGIEQLWEEQRQRQLNRDSTLEAAHRYGREAIVLPEISGSMKRRRKDRRR